jgi:hypothetical protein
MVAVRYLLLFLSPFSCSCFFPCSTYSLDGVPHFDGSRGGQTSLFLSSIHDHFFDLDDSFLSCDEWMEFSGIDWRLLGQRWGYFFDFCLLAHFFDVVQYNAQFSYAVQARFLDDRDQTCRNRMLNKYQGVS